MVKCQICGKRCKQITTPGHLKKHNITRQKYIEMFPGAEMVSPSTKKAHSRAAKKKVVEGTHFVPFRDIKGLARKVHDANKEGPVKYSCIRCNKVKKANRYLAERRKFCSNECHGLHRKENPELYKTLNESISRATSGRPKKGGYSRCHGGFRDDLGHYVRSGWEADVCRIFRFHNVPYDYEAYTVRLDLDGEDLFWTLDIVDPTNFLSNGLIEIKGWWDHKSQIKKCLMEKQRPDLFNRITFIDEAAMNRLIREYVSVIKHWETLK